MAGNRPRLGTLAAIALPPVALLLGFAWAGDWIGWPRVSGATLANALQYNAGIYPGYRRAHAKGLCFTGTFEANGAGTALSKAGAFIGGRYPVIGRFSTGGSDPFSSDGRNVFHAIGLQITAPDRQIWRMALDHTPIFPVSTPEAFVALQIATKADSATGKPDPAKVSAYMAGHPETKAFQDYLATQPLPDSFASGTYHSINAFTFIDAAGARQAVRWKFVPVTPLKPLDKARLDQVPMDYLFNEILQRLGNGPVRWHMVVQVAAPGDVTRDANVRWPEDRRQVDVGTLTIDRVMPEETGACRDITFDPTILPDGVALSDDPLLGARAAAYATSFARRAEEGAGPSKIGKELAKGK